MAFSDPLPLTLDGVVKNLVRIDTGKYSSEYALVEATQEFRCFIRSQTIGKPDASGRNKIRHNIIVRWILFATATTLEQVRQTSTSIDHWYGDDVTKFDDTAIAAATLLTAANVLKLNNYES